MLPPPLLRTFAVVPAAGASRRMGQQKLLLPWRTGTVLQHVLDTWSRSAVERTVLVVRRGDGELAEIGHHCGADVVLAESPPAEMKDSVCLALNHVARHYTVDPHAWWLLAPADCPGLTVTAINRVCQACGTSDAALLVPVCGGRRGHPVALAWGLAPEVAALEPGAGVNTLFGRHRTACLEVDEPGILEDLDTPDDFERRR